MAANNRIFALKGDVLEVTLPEGRSQIELVDISRSEIRTMAQQFHGMDLKISGRITTGMALMLGHELAHITKSVSIFDPKDNVYVLCVRH